LVVPLLFGGSITRSGDTFSPKISLTGRLIDFGSLIDFAQRYQQPSGSLIDFDAEPEPITSAVPQPPQSSAPPPVTHQECLYSYIRNPKMFIRHLPKTISIQRGEIFIQCGINWPS